MNVTLFRCFIVLMVLSPLMCVTASAGTPARFIKRCNIYQDPAINSPVVCQKNAGDEVEFAQAVERGFLSLEMEDCFGYVERACISFGTSSTPGTPAKRVVIHSQNEDRPLRLGFGGNANYSFGSVPYQSTASNGFGGELLANLIVPIGEHMHLSFGPTVTILTLGRSLDGTGVVNDDTPMVLSQRNTYLGATLLFGVKFDSKPLYDYGPGEPEWWLEAGFEALFPLSGTQTDNIGDPVSFTPPDKIVLAVLGPTGYLNLAHGLSLAGSLQGYYNIRATGGSKLYGGRLQVALQFSL